MIEVMHNLVMYVNKLEMVDCIFHKGQGMSKFIDTYFDYNQIVNIKVIVVVLIIFNVFISFIKVIEFMVFHITYEQE